MSKKEIINESQIVGRECRFAVYCPPFNGGDTDLHAIKEIIHLKDGRKIPNLRMVKNFQRQFWITKPGMQNHQQKKEWEKVENLIEYKTTQSQLHRNIARALNNPGFNGNPRHLARTPYLYGSDILSTALIKRAYQDKYKDLVTGYTKAMFDIETDVLYGHGQIQMATLSFKERVVTVIQKDFVRGYTDVEARLRALANKYLGSMHGIRDKKEVVIDILAERNINWEIVIVDNEAAVITETFKRAHQWQPDFVAIWNIDFDLPKSLEALYRAKINPADVFSDPSIPPAYRHFTYKQGQKQKKTASGKTMPIKPAAQWHTAFCPSSFYFIDAMCAYKHIRIGRAEEPSYSLDSILDKHLGMRKLKFKEAEHLTGLEWHQFMQEKHPLEYVIYNAFDCISMELLDEKTKDLEITLPFFGGCSDFENFKSQPRRTVDNLHFFCLERGHVIGSTSDQMTDEHDLKTIGIEGWISTLPAHTVIDNGLKCVEEDPTLSTNIRVHVAD